MIVNNRKPFGNPNAKADITGVFEILIPEEIWERIKKARMKHFRLTYSWIVRYMLSKLLRRKKFWQKVKVKKLEFEDKQYSKKRDDCHRFSLCLYGDDHVHLKTLAASLGISVSFLVRAAIFWYLDEFDADEIPDIMEGASEFRRYGKLSFEKVKKYGTKFVKNLEVQREVENYFSAWTFFESLAFDECDFW